MSDAPALFNFDGSRIQGIRDIFHAPVTHAGRTANLTMFVVPDHMGSTTGHDAIQQLRMVLEDATQSVRTVAQPNGSEYLSRFLSLLSEKIGIRLLTLNTLFSCAQTPVHCVKRYV